MKKLYLLISLPLALFVYALLLATKPAKNPSEEVISYYQRSTNEFRNNAKELLALSIQEEQGKVSRAKVVQQLIATRTSFKRIEWLYAFLHPEDAKLVNGPPLPKLDESALNPDQVIDPKGLQTLEELLADSTNKDFKKFKEILQELNNSAHAIPELFTYIQLNDHIVFEAIQTGIVRVSFIGITGFDSPALDLSLSEAFTSWQSMGKQLLYYKPMFEKASPSASKQLYKVWTEGELYLSKNKDFDTFDRFTFISKYANNSFRLLHELHVATGVELSEAIGKANQPINYTATTLFDPKLLNPYFYARDPYLKPDPNAAELGKMLFFDPILSKSNVRSCASCHAPEKGFTDGRAKSLALGEHGNVARNSPTIINSIFATKYFMDFRTNFLEEQIEHVIIDNKEFASNYTEIVQKLNTSSEYKQLFAKAFGANAQAVNSGTISYSIAQYIRTLTAFNSPFDKMIRAEKHPDQQVVKGFNLFMGKAACGTCHFAPVFNGLVPPSYNDTESEVLGVLEKPNTKIIDSDLGRFEVYKYKNLLYKHSFKTPGLRNVALTGPYMHNGAYETLEEVMDFYNTGGGKGMGLDVPNQTLPEDSLHLNKEEIGHLISFMKSLTDTTGLTSKPTKLPLFEGNAQWNERKVSGGY